MLGRKGAAVGRLVAAAASRASAPASVAPAQAARSVYLRKHESEQQVKQFTMASAAGERGDGVAEERRSERERERRRKEREETRTYLSFTRRLRAPRAAPRLHPPPPAC